MGIKPVEPGWRHGTDGRGSRPVAARWAKTAPNTASRWTTPPPCPAMPEKVKVRVKASPAAVVVGIDPDRARQDPVIYLGAEVIRAHYLAGIDALEMGDRAAVAEMFAPDL